MEEWRRIEGHPNHEVSNLGRVRSLDHVVSDKGRPSHRKGKVFHLTAGKNGYIRVFIERCCYNVHRLVAKDFIAQPDGCDVVNHLNGKKADNRVENLEWTTRSGNCIHAFRTGLNRLTEDCRRRLAEAQRGRKMSNYTRKRLAETRPKGYRHSEETKRKISASITKWHQQK